MSAVNHLPSCWTPPDQARPYFKDHEAVERGVMIFPHLEELHLARYIFTIIEADGHDKRERTSQVVELASFWARMDCGEVDKVKVDILEKAMAWLGLGNLDGVDDRPLSASEVASLRRMSITLGCRPETTASVGDIFKGIQEDDNFWMPVPFAAFASEVLETTVLVWEPDADGESFVLYRSDDHKGIFFRPEATAPPIHLLYHSGKIGDTEVYFSRDKAKRPSATSVPAHTYFDRIVLKAEENEKFDRYLVQSWQKVAMPAPSQSSTAPKQSRSPADTRSGPVKSPGNSTQCSYVFVIGKKKGTQCFNRRSPIGGGRCSRHKKKTAEGAPPVKSAHGHGGKREKGISAGGKRCAGGLNDQGFDEEEELDCTAGKGRGKHIKSGESYEAIERLAAKVPEAYRSMFRHVQVLQKTEEMHEDDDDDEDGLGGGSEKRRYSHGLPSDDYEARTTGGGETAKLSPGSRAALPQLRVEDIPRVLQDTGPLAFEMLQLTFPPQAVELVRDMMNEYSESSQNREPDTVREKQHEAKGPNWGFAKFSEERITVDDVHGMLGILIHMGLVRTCRLANAWSLHPNYNFPHVRNCMPRDFWFVLYSRFLRFAPAGVKTGDKLHHIRKLEEILNSAWSSAADVGAWLSVDAQMFKNTSKPGRSLHRFNLTKHVKTGAKAWGVAFFFTAITNGCLLKKMWVLELTEGIDKELELVGPLAKDEVKEGPMAGTCRGTLVEVKKRLRHVERMEKAKWDMDLCDYLMAKCNRGHADKGRHQHLRTPEEVPPPPRRSSAKWEKPLPSAGRVCDNPECGSRTKGACRCTDCASGVVICMKCFLSDTAHAAARTARFAQERPMQTRRKQPIDWSKFDRQQRQRKKPNVCRDGGEEVKVRVDIKIGGGVAWEH